MVRRGHVYYFEGTGALEYELDARRRRCRRVDSQDGGHVALETVNPERADDGRGVIFVTQFNISGRGGYGQMRLTDGQMVEAIDVFTKYLELPQRPVEVKVVLEQRERARKRRPSPAQALEDKSDTALSPEERAIHRRMLEGK